MATAQLATEADFRHRLPLFPRHVRQLLGNPGTLGLGLSARGLQVRHMVVSPRSQPGRLKNTPKQNSRGRVLLSPATAGYTRVNVYLPRQNQLCSKWVQGMLRALTATLANPRAVN